jgi:hypothetical protein
MCGDLVTEVDRRGLGERRFREAGYLDALGAQALFEPVEEDVATRLADVEQRDVRAIERRAPWRAHVCGRFALGRGIKQPH